MNLVDTLTTSPHYFQGKSIGTTNENWNFDITDYRVKKGFKHEKRVEHNSVSVFDIWEVLPNIH